jgi:Predicted AAA-ATPase/PD-(D/E)XK nuclease superfamily
LRKYTYFCPFQTGNKMQPIPYGVSNYETLAREGYFFVDKTPYLALLERSDRFVSFLRPRRFGKSLWVSILQYYYGMEHQHRFDRLFGHTAIGKKPTPLANGYLVLKFDFSGISTATDKSTKDGFLRNVKGGALAFLSAYKQYFQPETHKDIFKGNDPADVIYNLFAHWKTIRDAPKIYVLFDEYDHFANELIAFRLSDFKKFVMRNGFVHKFYETIKIATQDGAVDRVFITGVSPITLDSLTSGFNITTSLTTEPDFSAMLGFTSAETAGALTNARATPDMLPGILQDMEQWYNGYRFHPDAAEKVYNSDMVLYFAKHFAKGGHYPEDMLDENIASDYGKIRKTFQIAGREAVNRTVLREVLQTGRTVLNRITKKYNFEQEFTDNDFKSLLFYMGHLTVEGALGGDWMLKIPNQVIRKLYWEYFAALTTEDTGLVVNTDDLTDALRHLIHHNDPRPLFDLVARTLKALSNRDNMNFDEKHLKAIVAAYLSLSNSYLMRSKFEAERQYVDILLLKRLPFDMPRQFAFELKYLKKEATPEALEKETTEAVAQIGRYRATAELGALEGLQAWVAVFAGTELKVLEQV